MCSCSFGLVSVPKQFDISSEGSDGLYTDDLGDEVFFPVPFLARRDLSCPPATIFNLGLPRTGTTSISEYTNNLGFKSYHLIRPSFEEVKSCNDMDGTCDFYRRRGASDPAARVAFEDVPTYGLARALVMAYPAAKFILMVRSPESYSASVHFMLCNWVRGRCGDINNDDHLKIQTLLYGQAFPNFCEQVQRRPDLCDDLGRSSVAKREWNDTGLMKEFRDVQAHHDETVLKYVPKKSLLSLDLGATMNADRIFNFLGCNGVAPPFPHANAILSA